MADTIVNYLKKISKNKDSNFAEMASFDNREMLLEQLISMYEFTGEPDTLNFNFFMLYSICEGFAAVYKFTEDTTNNRKGDIVITRARLAGTPDPYGLGRDVIVSTENGFSKNITDYKNSENVEVFNLNRLYLPDISVDKTAYFLTETEKSMRAVLRLARYSRVIECKDEKTKEQITAALKAADAGSIATFVSPVVNTLLGDDPETVHDMSLTDVRNNDMLQYLSKFKSDLMRDFFNRYGMSSDGSEKMAQQTEAETNKGSFKSLILPISRLKLLSEFVEKVNYKFSLNISVDFSEPWKLEFARLLAEEKITADGEPEVPEGPEEPEEQEEQEEPEEAEEAEEEKEEQEEEPEEPEEKEEGEKA